MTNQIAHSSDTGAADALMKNAADRLQREMSKALVKLHPHRERLANIALAQAVNSSRAIHA